MQNDNLALHSLMLNMQLAYYWAFLFDDKGEPRTYTADGLAAQEANANKACKNVALKSIKQKTIPKRLFVYANAFVLHDDPIEIIENTYHLYHVDNAEEFEVPDEAVGQSM